MVICAHFGNMASFFTGKVKATVEFLSADEDLKEVAWHHWAHLLLERQWKLYAFKTARTSLPAVLEAELLEYG